LTVLQWLRSFAMLAAAFARELDAQFGTFLLSQGCSPKLDSPFKQR
jgi:hypothetical protein